MKQRFDFRLEQAKVDLVAVVGQGTKALGPEPLRVDNASVSLSGEQLEHVESAAVNPNDPEFAASTALLLLNMLNSWTDPRSIVLNRKIFADQYRRLQFRERSAIAHGFKLVGQFCDMSEPPTRDELISVDAVMLMTALLDIVNSITDEEKEIISNADRHADAAKHRAALDEVLENPMGWRTGDRMYYPSEAIELTSHIANDPRARAAIALLLIDLVENGDGSHEFMMRWARDGETYLSMPSHLAATFTAAARYLYESDEDWSPECFARKGKKPRKQPSLLPPVDGRFLIEAAT